MTRRVVITGMGIISSIGNDCREVLASLKDNRSGVEAVPAWSDYGFKSQVAGTIKMPDAESLREDFGPQARYMGVPALYALICAEQAIADSGLRAEDLASHKTGCISGGGFSNAESYQQAVARVDGGNRYIGPNEVTRSMGSSISANLSAYYGIKGRSYSISSACATSLHNIGHAAELIKSSACDVVLSGGAEELSPIFTSMFEGMRRVLSKSNNADPTKASRAFDKDRDGFVISGGAGMVILEEYEHAKARNATIYGEVTGFGTSSDGHDIIRPDPEGNGCYRCMDEAIQNAGCTPESVDYVNAHGTSTPAGDLAEANAVRKLFGEHSVKLSSTKSLTGHGIAASGAQELIYCLLMMKEGFVTASVNIENQDSAFDDLNIVTKNQECQLNTVMTNSFGFGGTNGTLLVSKVRD
jgi:3-oxoacyl-[acyl-carrier-protein] synthase I